MINFESFLTLSITFGVQRNLSGPKDLQIITVVTRKFFLKRHATSLGCVRAQATKAYFSVHKSLHNLFQFYGSVAMTESKRPDDVKLARSTRCPR